MKDSSPRDIAILQIAVRADTGGASTYISQLIGYLQAHHRHWRVAVASPLEKPFGPRYRSLADAFLLLPKRRFSLFAFFRLATLVRRSGVQIVHSHGPGAGIYARLLSFFGCRVVHTFHGVYNRPGWGRTLRHSIDRALRCRTHRFICVSESERRAAQNLGLIVDERTEVVQSGIDGQSLKDQAEAVVRNQARERFGVSEADFVIGTLARLDFPKGIDLLLTFLAASRQALPDMRLRLLIAGSGDSQKELLALRKSLGLDDLVTFVGEQTEIASFLRALDLYASASRWEGMPLAVLEAMAAGIPCLLSDIPAHLELSQNRQLAQIFSLGRPESFPEAILSMRDNPAAVLERRQRAQQWILSQHDVRQMCRRIAEIYGELLEFSGSKPGADL